MATDALIILADGSWGVLAGAVIFTVPQDFAEEFASLVDEHDIDEALERGKLNVHARFET